MIYYIAALFCIEVVYMRLASYFNIIDKPNERSSHSSVTIRGGGVVFYFGALLFFVLSRGQYPFFFLGLTAITIISFLDDIFTLPNKIRLLVHFLSISLLFHEVGLFGYTIWLIPFVYILGIGVINAYNFMDGINGMTAIYSLVVLALISVVNKEVTFTNQELINAVSIAVLVFGFFNVRQRARCFAGDVGSVSMAFVVVFLLATLIERTHNFIFILFLLVYGLDTVWTIVARLLRKENIFKAHRSHLYQYYVNENKSNKLWVSFIYGLVQLIVGLVVIYISTFSAGVQILFSVLLVICSSGFYCYLRYRLIQKHKLPYNKIAF